MDEARAGGAVPVPDAPPAGSVGAGSGLAATGTS